MAKRLTEKQLLSLSAKGVKIIQPKQVEIWQKQDGIIGSNIKPLPKLKKAKKPISKGKEHITRVLSECGYKFESELSFSKANISNRRFRFDWAIPELKIAIEYEGLTDGFGGGHQRPTAYTENCVKYNQALCSGWVILRYTGINKMYLNIKNDLELLISKRNIL